MQARDSIWGTLNAAQIDALVLTGKVWGFLKYHHPVITSGKKRWDFELLRRLPAILGAQRQDDVRRLLVDWIDSLGPLEECKPCAALEPKELQLAPRLDWIRDGKWLGEPLSQRLQAVFQNRVRISSSSCRSPRTSGILFSRTSLGFQRRNFRTRVFRSSRSCDSGTSSSIGRPTGISSTKTGMWC